MTFGNYNSDSLDIVEGIASSYANLFLVMNRSDLKEFSEGFAQLKNGDELWKFLKKYAVSRSDQNFWEHHKWFSEQSYEPLTNESGIIDLNRYINI